MNTEQKQLEIKFPNWAEQLEIEFPRLADLVIALLKAIGLNDYEDAIKFGMLTGPIEELPPTKEESQ